MSQKQRLQQIFELPDDETIFEDFGCALVDSIARHGRMFVCENYICFYSKIMGITKKKVIKVADIQDIQKKSILGMFKNAIKIVTEQKKYVFSSFSKRDLTFKLLYAIWKGEPFEQEEEIEEEYDLDGANDKDNEQQLENANVEILNLDENNENEKKQTLNIILPINSDQFFEMFYSDNAGFPFEEHLKRQSGATDIQQTKWEDNEEGNGKTRELKCTIKVSGVPFRDTSRLYKVQTYKREENGKIEIRSMSKALDVPYSQYYQFEELWEVTPLEEKGRCKLTVTAWVLIIKNFMWKNKVMQRGIEGQKSDCEAWSKSCQKYLQQYVQQQQQNSSKKTLELEPADKVNSNDLLINQDNNPILEEIQSAFLGQNNNTTQMQNNNMEKELQQSQLLKRKFSASSGSVDNFYKNRISTNLSKRISDIRMQ